MIWGVGAGRKEMISNRKRRCSLIVKGRGVQTRHCIKSMKSGLTSC